MTRIKQILMCQIGSDRLETTVLPVLIYLAALVFLVLAMNKLSTLTLSETESFFGILLVLAVGLLMVAVGMMTQLLATLKKTRGADVTP
jgi:hypothetical protein